MAAAAFNSVKNEIELLNVYPFLSKVAVDSEMPVPGYLFHEINALTYVDDGSNCRPLIEYFIRRLQSDSPVVKMKVLKMILHLTKNGHRKVSEEVKHYEAIFKQTSGISLPFDSSHLKQHYENIRTISQETLITAFSEIQIEDHKSNYTKEGMQQLPGYGSYSDYSRSRMVGFGNTPSAQKSIGNQLAEGFTSFVDKFVAPRDKKEFYKHQEAVLKESVPQYIPIVIRKPGAEKIESLTVSQSMPIMKQPLFMLQSTSDSGGAIKKRIPGRPGGGWDDSDEEDLTRDSFSSFTKDSTNKSECSDYQKSKDETSGLEYIEEEKLVDGFAVDLPLTQINPDQVEEIQDKSAKLNGDKLIELCLQKAAVPGVKEVVILRSLYMLEVLLLKGIISPESLDSIASSKLSELSTSEPVGRWVRAKAKKISLMNKYLLKESESLSKSRQTH